VKWLFIVLENLLPYFIGTIIGSIVSYFIFGTWIPGFIVSFTSGLILALRDSM
jgi:flagellar biosynthesis protein FliQ